MTLAEVMGMVAACIGVASMITGGVLLYALLFAYTMDKLTIALKIKVALVRFAWSRWSDKNKGSG